jgi:hypothetical protein
MNGLKALTFEIVLSINKQKCEEMSYYLYF